MLHFALSLALAAVAPAPPRALPPAFVPPPILMYHRVDGDRPSDPVGRELTITPQQFAAQLAYLHAHGIAGISMRDLLVRLQQGLPLDHLVVLTFDDGYADQYTDALPVLRRYGDHATFFVITGTIDTPRHLTWAQLRAMQRAGQEIGAHGVEHFDLSTMTIAQQEFQIDDCLRELRAHLRTPIYSYAYPSGRLNSGTLTLEHEAGIDLAVTTDPRFVLPPENRFEMTRMRVRSDWSLAEFADALGAALARGTIVRR